MEIIFLIAITVFILFRLFKVLGTVDEDEANEELSDYKIANEVDFDDEDDEISIQDAFEANMMQSLREIFDQYREIDSNFRAKDFFDKAKMAFTIVVEAFNSNDAKTLKPLLSSKILKAFTDEIKKRKSNKQKEGVKVVRHYNSEIIDAKLKGKVAQIKILFRTEQKFENEVDLVQMEDTWVFERDLSKKDPIWKLVST